MATEFSDIYLDGINFEELYADGGQIIEAWLDGECIWKLKEKSLTIHTIYSVTPHNEKYYVIFRAGIVVRVSQATGAIVWENLLYYIGTGNEKGIISEMKTIHAWNNYPAGTEVNAENYIAIECEKGLFVYYAETSLVGTEYIFFENYDISNQKTIITESPFKNISQTLPSIRSGIWFNAVITNKYIFYCTVNRSYRYVLQVTDFEHKTVKSIIQNYPLEIGDAQFYYISSDGGNKIFFYYAKGSDIYALKYGVVDIDSLEYWQETLNIEPISKKILDDFFEESVYEKPKLEETTWRINNSISVVAMSAGKYIFAEIYFTAKCTYKNTQITNYVSWGGKYLINIDNGSYREIPHVFQPTNTFDLGKKYTLYDKQLFYGDNAIGDKWPIDQTDNEIKSTFQNGFYTSEHYGANAYMFDYNPLSCIASKYPSTEILTGRE